MKRKLVQLRARKGTRCSRCGVGFLLGETIEILIEWGAKRPLHKNCVDPMLEGFAMEREVIYQNRFDLSATTSITTGPEGP